MWAELIENAATIRIYDVEETRKDKGGKYVAHYSLSLREWRIYNPKTQRNLEDGSDLWSRAIEACERCDRRLGIAAPEIRANARMVRHRVARRAGAGNG